MVMACLGISGLLHVSYKDLFLVVSLNSVCVYSAGAAQDHRAG